MHKLLLFLLLFCGSSLCVAAGSTPIYQGCSGGMMLHTGYLFGKESRAPLSPDGVLCSPQGATFGIGGTMRVHLWRLLRVGGEGAVSTLYSSTSDCRQLLRPGSYVRSGWGGVNIDACWRDLPHVEHHRLWPYAGTALGGGAIRSFYLIEGSQAEWNTPQQSLFHKQSFFYITPYVGIDWGMTEKIHLTIRADWMLAFAPSAPKAPVQLILPTGPRLSVGFMFCH